MGGGRQEQRQGSEKGANQDVLPGGHPFLGSVGLRNPARRARRPRRWNRWRAGSGGPAREKARSAAGPACEQRVGAVELAGSFPKLQIVEDLADDFQLFDDRLLETLPVAVWNRNPSYPNGFKPHIEIGRIVGILFANIVFPAPGAAPPRGSGSDDGRRDPPRCPESRPRFPAPRRS